MRKDHECMVDDCNNPVHAKGYCRKHYGQIWRKGRIYTEEDKIAGRLPGDDSDRIRSLERELCRAEMMYKNVIGFDGRIKWRREIDEVKKELKRLGIDPATVTRDIEDVLIEE